MSVAVTGMGMMTCLGKNRDDCFELFCRGKVGNSLIGKFDSGLYNTKYAYEIKDTGPDDEMAPESLKATQYLCAAINEAIRSADLTSSDQRIVVLIGTGLRELRSLELWWADNKPFNVEALHFGGAVRKMNGVSCNVITFSNACSATNHALGIAYDLLALDECDIAIVAGTDSITESMFGLLDRVNPMNPETLLPFDRNRRGVIMGEGAAAMVLEKKDTRAPVQAWLESVGISCDAFDITAPHQEGIVRAMRDAHERADINPEDVDLLFVHGTGTVQNDINEAKAIQQVFKRIPAKLRITGLKSLIGHTSGASGLIAGITAIQSLSTGRIPPTAGVEEPLDEVNAFDVVTEEMPSSALKFAQVNAFGFGGVNAVTIYRRGEL